MTTNDGKNVESQQRVREAILPNIPLQWKLTALVVLVLLFSGTVTGYFVAQSLTYQIDRLVGDKVLSVARMIASRPIVQEAFRSKNPPEVLQPLIQQWLRESGVDLIVIFNMDTIRYAHTNEGLVGLHFTGGDERKALEGDEYISHAVGVSGPSMRSFVPIKDNKTGEQIGVVVVGVLKPSLERQVQQVLANLAWISLLGLVVGGVGAALVAFNIKGSIFGLEPQQIRAILEERVAILQSIREGVIAVDKKNSITIINSEAQRILGVGTEVIGKKVSEVLTNTRLPEIVATGNSEFDQEQVVHGKTIITNRVPIIVEGKVVGAVATFRDMSEVKDLASELTGVKGLAGSLRAQAHEFVNRLHTVSGLLQLGRHEEAIRYIAQVTRTHEEMVGFVSNRIHEHALAGLILGKMSTANERGISISLDPDSYVPVRDSRLVPLDLVTLVGNLIENAFEAVAPLPERQRNVWVSLYCGDKEMLIEVEDTGIGIDEESKQHIFDTGYTTKNGNKGIGLGLVMDEVNKVSGSVEVESKMGVGTRFIVHLPFDNE